MNPDIFSNKFTVEFDEQNRSLLIYNANKDWQMHMTNIRWETLQSMSFAKASQFIGESLILRMPPLRELYRDYLWTDDGGTPPKKNSDDPPA